MKRLFLLSVVALSGLTTAATSLSHASADVLTDPAIIASYTAQSAPPTPPSASEQTNIYRLYNSNTGEHFYTSSYFEAFSDYKAGWNIEGVGWTAPTTGAPVYRLYNPNAQDAGTHYYTLSSYEASQLSTKGWRNEGVVFYSGGSTAIYVDYNPNNSGHNYTTNRAEADSLVSAGWKYDQVAFKAVGSSSLDGALAHPIGQDGVATWITYLKDDATGQIFWSEVGHDFSLLMKDEDDMLTKTAPFYNASSGATMQISN